MYDVGKNLLFPVPRGRSHPAMILSPGSTSQRSGCSTAARPARTRLVERDRCGIRHRVRDAPMRPVITLPWASLTTGGERAPGRPEAFLAPATREPDHDDPRPVSDKSAARQHARAGSRHEQENDTRARAPSNRRRRGRAPLAGGRAPGARACHRLEVGGRLRALGGRPTRRSTPSTTRTLTRPPRNS